MAHLAPTDHQKMLDQLARHEESRKLKYHTAYRCTAGALTIGYGHNLDANPLPGVDANSRLTDGEAKMILNDDVAAVEKQIKSRLPWALDLAPARYAVLVNMAFNLGIAGLMKFTNTLMFVQSGHYTHAANNMMQSLWAKQVGDGPGGYFDRAEELSAQMKSGEWQCKK